MTPVVNLAKIAGLLELPADMTVEEFQAILFATLEDHGIVFAGTITSVEQ